MTIFISFLCIEVSKINVSGISIGLFSKVSVMMSEQGQGRDGIREQVEVPSTNEEGTIQHFI
jgi:hypothetical protein